MTDQQFPNIERFQRAQTDDERLALGIDALRAAWDEAEDAGLLGWAEEIHEYVYAVESGKGLNRPFSSPPSGA